jgi:nucleotide-binding universal stress UspA family protein
MDVGQREMPAPQRFQTATAGFKRILVAVDGSENAERATKVAIELAGKFGSELIVLHVIGRPSYTYVPMFPSVTPPQAVFDEYHALSKKAAEGYVGKAVSLADGSKVKVRGDVQEGRFSVVQGITEYADNEKVDLIIVGTRGLGGFTKLVIGSVSSGVVTHAHCPVLVVR